MTAAAFWYPPLWLDPVRLPDEPPHGIFMRLAARNGMLRMRTFENMTGVKLRHLRTGQGLDRLAAMLHCDVSDIDTYAIRRTGNMPLGGYKKSMIAGHEVQRKDDLMMSDRRACTACLTDSTHHRYWWDLRFMTCCPIHCTRLATTCSCGNKLSWADASLTKCCLCEFGDIRGVHEEASSDLIELDRWILGRLHKSANVLKLPLIDDVPLGRAIEIIERIGALTVGGYKKTWQEITDYDKPAEQIRAIGFQSIVHNRIESALDRAYAGFAAEHPSAKGRLLTMYGWFFPWLSYAGRHRYSPELVNIVHANAALKIQVSRLALPWLQRDTKTITLVETAKLCHARHSTVRKLLAAEDMIRDSKRKGSPISVRIEVARRLAADLADSATLREVGSLIGIGQTALIKLVRSDRVPMWIRGGNEGKHEYIFRRAAIVSWLKTVIGTPPIKSKKPSGSISISEAPTKANIPINTLVDALISGRVKVVACTSRPSNFATAFLDLQSIKTYRSQIGARQLRDPIAAYMKTSVTSELRN